MLGKRPISKELLEELYLERKLPAKEVAKILGVSEWKVYDLLKKHGIPTRSRRKELDRDLLYRLYIVERKSLTEICKLLGVSRQTVRRYLEKYGFEIRDWYSSLYPDNAILPKSMSEDLAYVLGVLYGDGWVLKYKRKLNKNSGWHKEGHIYRIGLATIHKEFRDKFAEACSKLGYRVFKYIRKPNEKRFGKKPQYTAEFRSKVFYEWFNNLTLEDLEKMLSEKESFIWKFIEGFYESEGSIIHQKHRPNSYTITLPNTNRELLEMICRLLKRVGVEAHINGPYEPSNVGKKKLWILAIHRKKYIIKFFKNVNPIIKRWEHAITLDS